MKLIDYDKYTKKSSPRATIVNAVISALVAGFFLGSALIDAVLGRDIWKWMLPLAMGLLSGLGALQSTLVALRTCPPSFPVPESKTIPDSTRA
jgi:hypothetical protein